MHSFTKNYEDRSSRDYQVGILFRERSILVDSLEAEFIKNNISYRLNEPYHPRDGVCFVLDSLQSWTSDKTDVILLEFRNDYCSDPVFQKQIANIFTPILQSLQNKKI